MTSPDTALRTRFLQDRVLTATPAQRVVMLYDRLLLDLDRAAASDAGCAPHLTHATSIVAELLDSLDRNAGGPADNLAQLYGYLLCQLTECLVGQDSARVAGLRPIAAGLRDAFAEAAAATGSTARTSATVAAASVAGAVAQATTAGFSAMTPAAWVS